MNPYSSVHEYIEEGFPAALEEIRRFLRQPGFSHTGEGVRESAQMALEYVRELGTDDAELVETDGNPVVFGHLRSERPDAKTLVMYSLYDVVPITPADWVVPPLAAEIIDAEQIGEPASLGKILCARGAMNQRGPMLAAILALKAMKEVTGDIPCNIIWAWEGEEEIGSPHLGQFIAAKTEELRTAQGVWAPSMRQDRNGVMHFYRGARGKQDVELRIKGGAWGGTPDGQDIWSAYMPMSDAPMLRMIRVLGSLLDENDRLTLDGADELLAPYDETSEEELATLRAEFDFEMLRGSIGVTRFKNGASGPDLLEDYIMKPMMNVVGITGGYQGPGVYTTLPMDVTAKIDLRIPPHLVSTELIPLLRAHLDRRGFTEIEIVDCGGYEYLSTPASDPLFTAGAAACRIHDCAYLSWPARPGVGPTSWFFQPPLNIPVSEIGMGHGGRWHQANEFVTVDGLQQLMKFTVTYLNEWADR
jgi:acetylornithine deacetylase/succinyl-diaminopimelate desuccinylase-like protein